MKRRHFITSVAATATATTLIKGCASSENSKDQASNGDKLSGGKGDIKVGVLFSLTGGLAIVEKSLSNIT